MQSTVLPLIVLSCKFEKGPWLEVYQCKIVAHCDIIFNLELIQEVATYNQTYIEFV